MEKRPLHVLISGPAPKEMAVVRSVASKFGLEYAHQYNEDPNTYKDSVILLLGPKYSQASCRVTPIGVNSLAVKIPAIGKSKDGDFVKALSLVHKAVNVACKLAAGMSLDVPNMPEITVHKAPRTIKAWLSKFKSGEIAVLDIETTGLNPYSDKMVCIGIASDMEEGEHVIHGHNNCIEVVRHLIKKETPVAACNAVFEQKWFFVCCEGTVNLVSDAQIDHCLVSEENYHRLDVLAGLIGAFGYDLEMEDFTDPVNEWVKSVSASGRKSRKKLKRKIHEASTELLTKYNAEDVEVTKRLIPYFQSRLSKEPGNPKEVQWWLLRGQDLMAKMSARGVKIDAHALMKEIPARQEELARLEEPVIALASRHGMKNYNPGSSVQRNILLYEKMRMPVLKLTNKRWISLDKYRDGWWIGQGSPSSDSESLEMVFKKTGDQTVQSMLEANSIRNVLDGILSRCADACQSGGGFLHSYFSITKLVTGQVSSTEPPMQNVPKDSLRRVFVSRFKGGSIMEIDYSQLHLRIIGNLAKCEGFIESYCGGGKFDLHSRTAARVILGLGEDEWVKMADTPKAKDARTVAKRTNFSIIFEIGANALAMKTGKSINECKQIISSWFAEYPEIKDQIKRQHSYAQRYGYVISPVGRVRHLPGVNSHDIGTKLRALRQAGDFLVSNSGRSITLYGMILLDQMMEDEGLLSCVDLQVHDSVRIDVAPGEEQAVTRLAKTALIDELMNMFSSWMDPIPLVMEGFIGPNWYAEDKKGEVEL